MQLSKLILPASAMGADDRHQLAVAKRKRHAIEGHNAAKANDSLSISRIGLIPTTVGCGGIA